MSRVVVTGASGFIGRHLARALAARGHEVVGISRRAAGAGATAGTLREIAADLLEPASYAGALEGADAVVHLAGLVESRRPEEFRRMNVEATCRLVETCRRLGAPRRRFVQVSSVAAMGPAPRGELLREADSCRPVTEYGRSKQEAELAARTHAEELGLIVLRPSFVYGPGDERGLALLTPLLSGAAGGLGPVLVRRFTVCHVSDVVAAVLLALDREAAVAETFLVSSPELLTWDLLRAVVRTALAEVAPELAAAARSASPGAPAARFARVAAAGGGQEWGCDTARARRLLGFSARVPLEEGVRETLRWYRDHGRLATLLGAAAGREKEAS